MPLFWILIGTILFVLGATVSYFSGIRSIQASRRLADFRVRDGSTGRMKTISGEAFLAQLLPALVSHLVAHPDLFRLLPRATQDRLGPRSISILCCSAVV